MCDFRIDAQEMKDSFGLSDRQVAALLVPVAQAFDGLLHLSDTRLFIPPAARPLTRMVARAIDAYDLSKAGHSSAI